MTLEFTEKVHLDCDQAYSMFVRWKIIVDRETRNCKRNWGQTQTDKHKQTDVQTKKIHHAAFSIICVTLCCTCFFTCLFDCLLVWKKKRHKPNLQNATLKDSRKRIWLNMLPEISSTQKILSFYPTCDTGKTRHSKQSFSKYTHFSCTGLLFLFSFTFSPLFLPCLNPLSPPHPPPPQILIFHFHLFFILSQQFFFKMTQWERQW